MILATIDYGELALILAGVFSTVVAAGIGGVKWLGKHFDKQQAIAAAQSITSAREKTEQRTDFLAALNTTTDRFTVTLGKLEAECVEQRELDRAQRVEDRSLLMRAIGLASTGDTGKYRAAIATPPPRSRGPSAQGEPS